MASKNSSGASAAPQKDLKTVKAEQKARRQQAKIDAKQAKKDRKAAKKNSGTFKQIRDVFKMTREEDPAVVWWMIGAVLIAMVVGVLIGLLLNNWILWLIISIPFGVLAALMIMNRRAEKAAFGRIKGRPGASGAALSTLGRGWIVPEEPIAINARTQDAVFRAVGRAGVVLVAEGEYNRARRLVEKERNMMRRFLPNVAINTFLIGDGKDQIELTEVKKTVSKLPKVLNKHEIQAVENRLASMPSAQLPIPKGVDPNKMRPDRRALRGR